MPFYSIIKSMKPRKRLRFFMIASWVCLGLGVLMIALQVLFSWQHQKTYGPYLPHQGTILIATENTRLDEGQRRYENHSLVYRYDYGKQSYEKAETIKQTEVKYDAAELGQGVRVRVFVNPESPDQAQLNIQPSVFLSYGMFAIAMLLSYFVVYQFSVRRWSLWWSYLIIVPLFIAANWGQWQINLHFFPHEQDDVTLKLIVLIILSLLYVTLPFPFLGKFIRSTQEELMSLKLQEMNYDELKPEAAASPPTPLAQAPEVMPLSPVDPADENPESHTTNTNEKHEA